MSVQGKAVNEELWFSCVEPTPMLEFLQEIAGDRKSRLFACSCCRRIWNLITEPCSRSAVEVAEQFADEPASEQDRFRVFTVAIQEANRWANGGSALHAACGGGAFAAAFAIAETETIENAGDAVIIAECRSPNFMRTPTLIAALEASGTASSAALAWAESRQEWFGWEEEDQTNVEVAVVAEGALLAAAVGIFEATPDTDWEHVYQKVQVVEEEAQCDLLRDIFGNPFRPAPFSSSWRTDTALVLARQMYDSRDFSAMSILADALQDAGCDNDDILAHCRDANQVHVRGRWVVDLVLGKE